MLTGSPQKATHGHTRAAIRNRIWTMKLMVSRPLRGLARRLFFTRAEAIALPGYDEHPPATTTAPRPPLSAGSRPA